MVPILLLLLFAMAGTANAQNPDCTLSGNYNNTNQFQNALNAAEAAGCTEIILTGNAQWSGDISVPTGTTLIIAGTGTVNGNGTLTSDNDIGIADGGTFNGNGNTVVIGGTTYTNVGTILGPTTIATALPVELLSFDLKQANGQVELHWSTAQESDNHYFGVYHSTDGRYFSLLERVTGAGHSDETQHYAYVHKPSDQGDHYYRLSQTDYDGTTVELGTKKVFVGSLGGGLVLVPNPVKVGQGLSVQQLPATVNQVILLNVIGQQWNLMLRDGQVSLPTGIPPGVYYLSVPGEQGVRMSALVIE